MQSNPMRMRSRVARRRLVRPQPELDEAPHPPRTDTTGEIVRLSRKDWRAVARVLATALWRAHDLDALSAEESRPIEAPFDAPISGIEDSLFSGFDPALAREADLAIGRYVAGCVLARHEANGRSDPGGFDALFASGLDFLLDVIEACRHRRSTFF